MIWSLMRPVKVYRPLLLYTDIDIQIEFINIDLVLLYLYQ